MFGVLMDNPWINYSFENSAIHTLDEALIEEFNLKAKPKVSYNKELLPDPYIGNINTKILLLMLNPGISENDFFIHKSPEFIKLHRKNIDQKELEYPFYYLNPELDCPGSDYWHKKLGTLIKEFGVKKISQTFCCLQLVAYHSVAFKKSPKLLPTQEFTKNILKNHMKNNLPIIIMRSRTMWESLVPELKSYKNFFVLNSFLNPVITPNNVGEDNFDVIKTLIASE
jgi:hypothetical protein